MCTRAQKRSSYVRPTQPKYCSSEEWFTQAANGTTFGAAAVFRCRPYGCVVAGGRKGRREGGLLTLRVYVAYREQTSGN